VTNNSTININQIHCADDIQVYSANYLNGVVMDSYQGPEFSVLDERVQQELIEFLAQLGIDDQLGSFIEVLSVDKDQRSYINWMKKVQAEFLH
jgi:hypothetical protein